MRTAGKVIAAIFASICIVASLTTIGFAFVAQAAQEDPAALTAEMEEITADSDVPESSQADVEAGMEAAADFLLGIDAAKMRSQGIVGLILSLVILVTIFINIAKMPIITPAIASVAALGGAVYCGWVIMFFMVLALIGCVLVLIANLKTNE